MNTATCALDLGESNATFSDKIRIPIAIVFLYKCLSVCCFVRGIYVEHVHCPVQLTCLLDLKQSINQSINLSYLLFLPPGTRTLTNVCHDLSVSTLVKNHATGFLLIFSNWVKPCASQRDPLPLTAAMGTSAKTVHLQDSTQGFVALGTTVCQLFSSLESHRVL